MTDSYRSKQQAFLPYSSMLKRQRSNYDVPASSLSSSNEMHNHITRVDDHTGPRMLKDTKSIELAYDRYLKSGQHCSSFTSMETNTVGGLRLAKGGGGGGGGGLSSYSLADPAVMGHHGGGGPDLAPNGQVVNYGGKLLVDVVSRPEPKTIPLPPDASSTLYVKGLPFDITRREVAHIFRPFVGYREVRLVEKESKHRGKDNIILCFVDFANPACAATAMSALQGYKIDELNPSSSQLRLQFSRCPGPRNGQASHSK